MMSDKDNELPRWCREARERGREAGYFRLHYTNHEGLAFKAYDNEKPMCFGGHHGGSAGCISAAELLRILHSRKDEELERMRPSIAWFIPFLECMVRGVDFGLADVTKRALPPEAQLALESARGESSTTIVVDGVNPSGAARGSKCQICGDELVEALISCAVCLTVHHRGCVEFAGRCSTYACGSRRFRACS
jgi:hypothetical protein